MNSFKKKLAAFTAICAIGVGVGIAVVSAGPGPTPMITLTPSSATNPVGTPHTVTANTFQSTPGNPHVDLPSKQVTFTVLAGSANAGAAGTCNPADCKSSSPDALVDFTYTGTNVGTDTIQACFTHPAGSGTPTCTTATKTWVAAPATPSIELDPDTATNLVGDPHTVTATLINAAVGTAVTFSVAGANVGASGTCNPATCQTNASNQVTFTYTGTNTGDDDITACFTPPAGTPICDTVDKDWVPVPQPSVVLDPDTATNFIGDPHTVTATVINAPANTLVTFAVAGVNGGAAGTCNPATCQTDASGQVTFTYTGTNIGDDDITACFTPPSGGTPICDTVDKDWVARPSGNIRVTVID